MNGKLPPAAIAVICACACTLSPAQDSSPSATEDAEIVIKANPAYADKQSRPQRVWLAPGIPEAQYNMEIIALANLLAADKPDAQELSAAEVAIKREPAKSGAAFGTLLDWKHHNETARRGALRGIQLSGAPAKSVGQSLGNSAFAEPDAKIRSASIDLIRERTDPVALHTLLGFLAAAADNTGLGIVNAAQRDAALAALHDVGDKRVFQILLYYVTLEIRAGVASAPSVDSKFITNSGDVANGGGTLNLPIDLPSLELGSVQGTIVVPAIADPMFALKRVTGQDFGKEVGKWKQWIDEQPAVRK